MLPAPRPVGLIALVLIVDLGLAAAGGALLVKGLAAKDAGTAKSNAPAETATDKKSEAPAQVAIDSVAAAVPAAAAIDNVAVVEPQPVAAKAPRATASAARERRAEPKRKTAAVHPAPASTAPAENTAPSQPAVTEATRVTAVPSAPQDPYPDPAREIDAAAAHSKPAFARCAADHGPAHGTIQIAFQVRSDGRIANAAAVENSTGNSELARCLVTEIASWRVSAHGGATIDMFRPFTYP